jgi:Ca-activated chloride channel homolog
MSVMRIPARSFITFLLLCCAGWAQTQTPAPPASQNPSSASPEKKPDDASAKGTQQSNGDDLTSAGTIKVPVSEVNVIFTVTDKHGKFIKDLTQNEFKVLDNNKPPKEIREFKAQTDLPLRIGLLIDASNSIRDRFLFEQQAAIEFLQQTIRREKDKAFVLAFDEVPEITQDFTSDKDQLTKGVKLIRPGGGTAMWDAVYYACRDKLMKLKEDTPVRRVIVLVSDGDDNQSRVLRQEAIDMAQRANVLIYTISTNLSNIQDNGDHNLKMLAEATGGRSFLPYKLQELADDFNEIQGELRSQYSIFYKPDELIANGQFRNVQISPENKKFKVRAKKGYFAPKIGSQN